MNAAKFLIAAVLIPGAWTCGDARAAESYDNCSGVVNTLPTVITSQGTWCLQGDLATALASGSAISVTVNNVIIDCNGFKLGGLAAGAASGTVGIQASSRYNLVVRNCNVRGFRIGVNGTGAAFVIEDNRFEANTQRGISLTGDGMTVRRNIVVDTGGSTTGTGAAIAVHVSGASDIVDNAIGGVVARAASGASAWGISVADDGDAAQVNIDGNRVRGVLADGAGSNVAIRSVALGRVAIRGNALFGSGADTGIRCGAATGVVRDNAILGFGTGLTTCSNDGGNTIKP